MTYFPCEAKLLNVATPENSCLRSKPGMLVLEMDDSAARATSRVVESILEC